jgi:hypothetical protein
MPKEFISHLIHNLGQTWVFVMIFLMWPIAFGLGALALDTSSDGLGWGEAVRRSVSLYLGFGKDDVPRCPLIIHRTMGALAWAYVVALFIASIS